MAELFRAEFEILEPLEQVAEEARDWFITKGPFPEDAATSSGVWEADEQSLEVWRGEHETESAWVLRWSIPISPSQDSWRVEFQAAASSGTTKAEARIHLDRVISGDETHGRPLRLGLVRELVDRFQCVREGVPLRTSAAIVREVHAKRFCEQALLNRERTFPVVTLSETDNGETALDPDALQRELAGVALVTRWGGATSRRMADILGRSLTCYGGALRVYRPDIRRDDNAGMHRYVLFSRAQRPAFEAQLRGYVTEMSTHTTSARRCQEIIARIREGQQNALSRRVEELSSLLEAGQSASQSERADSRESVSVLRREIDDLAVENQQLREKLEKQDAALEMVAEVRAIAPDQEPMDEPATVAEAIMLARAYCSRLDLLPSADESAGVSRYQQPDNVWAALERLNELAERVATGEVKEEMVVGAMKVRGYDVSTESIDTMRRYADERLFRDDDGGLIDMPMHIKLGGGRGQDNFCRIHFKWNSDTGQFQIGHVGRHLQTSRS